uniref:Proteophosphoglycan ppg4, related n=1 Tax=Neospora caninum (strain Liverpool) TaxID=572307 RepID=A0A0F7UNC7_NEOCL|nr:TPA: Proteophosphoglycan ppg4, related [Neospora caninum Liverpool]
MASPSKNLSQPSGRGSTPSSLRGYESLQTTHPFPVKVNTKDYFELPYPAIRSENAVSSATRDKMSMNVSKRFETLPGSLVTSQRRKAVTENLPSLAVAEEANDRGEDHAKNESIFGIPSTKSTVPATGTATNRPATDSRVHALVVDRQRNEGIQSDERTICTHQEIHVTATEKRSLQAQKSSQRNVQRETERVGAGTPLLSICRDNEKTRASEAGKQSAPYRVNPSNTKGRHDESKTPMLQHSTETRLPREQPHACLSREQGSRSSGGETKRQDSGKLTVVAGDTAAKAWNNEREGTACGNTTDTSRKESLNAEKLSRPSSQTCARSSAQQNTASTNSTKGKRSKRDAEETARSSDPCFRATTSENASAASPLSVGKLAAPSFTIDEDTVGPGSNKQFFSTSQTERDDFLCSRVEEETVTSKSNVQESLAEIACALPPSKRGVASIGKTSSFTDTETVLESHFRVEDKRHQVIWGKSGVGASSAGAHVFGDDHGSNPSTAVKPVSKKDESSWTTPSQTKSQSHTSQRRASMTSVTNTRNSTSPPNVLNQGPTQETESPPPFNCTYETESRNRRRCTNEPSGLSETSDASANAHASRSGRGHATEMTEAEVVAATLSSERGNRNQGSRGERLGGERDLPLPERRYSQAVQRECSNSGSVTDSGVAFAEAKDNWSHGGRARVPESSLSGAEGSTQRSRPSGDKMKRMSRGMSSCVAEQVLMKAKVEKRVGGTASSKHVSRPGLDTSAARTNESKHPQAQAFSEKESHSHSHSSQQNGSPGYSSAKAGLSDEERERTNVLGNAGKSTVADRGSETFVKEMEADSAAKTTSRDLFSASRHLLHGSSSRGKDSSRESQPPAPLIVQAGSGSGKTLNASIHLSTLSGAFTAQHTGETGTTFSVSAPLCPTSEVSDNIAGAPPSSSTEVKATSEISKADTQSAARQLELERGEKSMEGKRGEDSRKVHTPTPEGEFTRNNLNSKCRLNSSHKEERREKRMSSKRIETELGSGDRNDGGEREMERRSRNAERSQTEGSEVECSRTSMRPTDDTNAATRKNDMREASERQAVITSTETRHTASRPEEGRRNEKAECHGDENENCGSMTSKNRIGIRYSSTDSSFANKGGRTKTDFPSSIASSASTMCTSSSSSNLESLQCTMHEQETKHRGCSRRLSGSLHHPSAGPNSASKNHNCSSVRQAEGLMKTDETLASELCLSPDELLNVAHGANQDETLYLTAEPLFDASRSSRKSDACGSEVRAPEDSALGKGRSNRQAGHLSQVKTSSCDSEDKPLSLNDSDGKERNDSTVLGERRYLPPKRPTIKGNSVSTRETPEPGENLSNSNAGMRLTPQIPPLPKALQHLSLLCTGETENGELRALTQIQQSVMEHIAAQAITESAVVRLRIQRQLRNAGISTADLESVEEYLVNKMPLTIAVDLLNVVPHLLEDNSYK